MPAVHNSSHRNSGQVAAIDLGENPVVRVRRENIPQSMRDTPNWVLWRYKEDDEGHDVGKIPLQPNGRPASCNDPDTWSTFEDVWRAYSAHPERFDGISFALDGEGTIGIDLDAVVDVRTGSLRPWPDEPEYDGLPSPDEIVRRIDSYSEVSPGGHGLRIFARGELPWPRYKTGNFEIYDDRKLLTVTGDTCSDCDVVEDRPQEIADLHLAAFGPRPERSAASGDTPNLSDEEVLEIISRAANARKFLDLYERGACGQNASVADLSMAGMLAFYSSDPEQIERIMRGSALRRDKWDDHRTYLARTIDKAIAECSAHYSRPAGKKPREASAATRMVKLAGNCEFWKSTDGDPCVTAGAGGHKEHMRVTSNAFRMWLHGAYFQETERVPTAAAITDAVHCLEAKAYYGTTTHEAFVRTGGDVRNELYLDLCGDDWKAVRIDQAGWRVVDAPIRFLRAKGMQPLPTPQPGNIDLLREFFNVLDEDWILVVAWLTAAMLPRGPYTVLGLHGEQGSGKSTAARVLRRLIDPNKADLRTEPRDTRELMISARNGWVVALDNLSYLEPWLSDALSRLSTGGGFAVKKNYTDDEEMIFNACRPILLNGIEEVATRSDLLDRSILINLPTLSAEARVPDSEFWQCWNEDHPRILGGILDVVAGAKSAMPDVQLERLPRMADFARWGVAVERALSLRSGTFMAAYDKKISQVHHAVVDNSIIMGPLRGVLARLRGREKWEGTMSTLLRDLNDNASEEERRRRGWPKGAHVLSGLLRRLTPNLRAVGINITFNSGHTKTVEITFGNDA